MGMVSESFFPSVRGRTYLWYKSRRIELACFVHFDLDCLFDGAKRFDKNVFSEKLMKQKLERTKLRIETLKPV